MSINKYFDKIYLLNLFKRKDRLTDAVNRLNNLEIEFEVFNGVDGSVMNHIWKKINNPYFTNSSYVGCSLSHLSIYRDSLDRGYKRILILEDDNLINQNIESIFNSMDIPQWSDLFYIGYIPLSDDCTMWDYNRYGIGGHNALNGNFFNPKNLWGLFSYGISDTLMKEMIDLYNEDFPMEIDRYFVQSIQPRGNSIAMAPQLFCCQDNVFSDNLGFSPDGMKYKSVDSRYARYTDYI